MKYVAALYTSGRMVLGCNHGEAFSKLSVSEQEGRLDSGFYDPETGRFFTEEEDFYVKQFLLIRHGEASGDILTEMGTTQVKNTARFLSENYDLTEFEAYNSPFARCRRTADIISAITGITFSSDPRLSDRFCEETTDEFLARVHEILVGSPPKSIYITHSDFIANFSERAVRQRIEGTIPGGSVTYIDSKKLVYCGRTP